MAGEPARKRATYQDVLDAPPNMVAQVVEGEFHLQARPAARHAVAASLLLGELHGFLWSSKGGPGGWVILFEPELHIGSDPDILVPDLAGWRRERLPEIPDSPFFSIAPDWVCEVVSLATASVDRVLKLPIYAREHVRHVWLVDPRTRILEVFRLEGAGWLLVGAWEGAASVRAEPFAALELDLGLLWSR
jgi:Uma2 family endonuclease